MIQTALKKVAKDGYSEIYHLRLELSGVCMCENIFVQVPVKHPIIELNNRVFFTTMTHLYAIIILS